MAVPVTGATGVIGRAVVGQLLEAGASVRALTREPAQADLPAGAEVVRGNLADPATLGAALRGVDRLFLLAIQQTAREVVVRAREPGIRRIVVLSAGAVTFGMDTAFHLPVERAVEASGLEWTHIRPGEFAYNKVTLWGPSIRAERRIRYPNPDRLQTCPVHEQDVAAVAVRALLDDGHAGKAYTFTGPGKITLREQAQAIATAIGDAITFEEATAEEALRLARAHGGRTQEVAEVLLGFTARTVERTAQRRRPMRPRSSPCSPRSPSSLGSRRGHLRSGRGITRRASSERSLGKPFRRCRQRRFMVATQDRFSISPLAGRRPQRVEPMGPLMARKSAPDLTVF